MSGIEVLGLISSIITVIDTVVQLYNAIKDTPHLPRAFREVVERLPLVRNTLRAAEERIRNYNTDRETCEAIKPTVEKCKEKVEHLESILQQMAPQRGASSLHRYRLAVRRLGKESQVEELMKGILEDVQLVAGNRAIQAASEAQVAELLQAINELSEVPSSISECNPSHTFTNYGTGNQFNAPGGTQNNNTGSGIQFPGSSFTAPVYFGEGSRPHV